MNDKQMTALILLLIVAFTFWLYNTGKLTNIIGTITGKQSSTTVQVLPSPAGTPTITIPGNKYPALPELPSVGTPNLGSYQTDGNGNPTYSITGINGGNVNFPLLNAVPYVDALGAIQFIAPDLLA